MLETKCLNLRNRLFFLAAMVAGKSLLYSFDYRTAEEFAKAINASPTINPGGTYNKLALMHMGIYPNRVSLSDSDIKNIVQNPELGQQFNKDYLNFLNNEAEIMQLLRDNEIIKTLDQNVAEQLREKLWARNYTNINLITGNPGPRNKKFHKLVSLLLQNANYPIDKNQALAVEAEPLSPPYSAPEADDLAPPLQPQRRGEEILPSQPQPTVRLTAAQLAAHDATRTTPTAAIQTPPAAQPAAATPATNALPGVLPEMLDTVSQEFQKGIMATAMTWMQELFASFTPAAMKAAQEAKEAEEAEAAKAAARAARRKNLSPTRRHRTFGE